MVHGPNLICDKQKYKTAVFLVWCVYFRRDIVINEPAVWFSKNISGVWCKSPLFF